MEDNVWLHRKARTLVGDLITRFVIDFLDTPANLPDLNPIEHLHKDEKAELKKFCESVRSVAGVIKDEAEFECNRIW